MTQPSAPGTSGSANANGPAVVIAPDSFKGCLSALAAAQAIGRGVLRACPDADIRLRPMADGGEGTIDAMLVQGGERLTLTVRNAAGTPADADVAILPNGSAIVEVANIVGLGDPSGTASPVTERDTRGVGEALLALIDRGVTHCAFALGGSSTNDGGAGLLVALGARLLDAEGAPLPALPSALARVARVDIGALDPRLAKLRLTVMSDVDNPLTGAHGATAVFGPQKGVKPGQVAEIDAALGQFGRHAETAFAARASAKTSASESGAGSGSASAPGAPTGAMDAPGAGAAGGLGFALRLIGARYASGAQTVADTIGLNRALTGAAWLITGEGRSDAQTLNGKAPFVVARRARAAGIPTLLLSGGIAREALDALRPHFDACFSPALGPETLENALHHAAASLEYAAEQLTRVRFGLRG